MTHEADLHLLVHTARMQTVLNGNPKHPRRKEYANQIAAYRMRWAQIAATERKGLASEAVKIADMSRESVRAAVAELES